MKCRICHKKRRKSIMPIPIVGGRDLEEEGTNTITCCSKCRGFYRTLNHKLARKARSNRRELRSQSRLREEA